LIKKLQILLAVILGKIVKKAMPFADESHKTTTGWGILAVRLKMFGEGFDSLREKSNLDGSAASVGGTLAVLLNNDIHVFFA
jgi:hypothetical protein